MNVFAKTTETTTFVIFVGLAAALTTEAVLRLANFPLLRFADLPVAGLALATTFLVGLRLSRWGSFLALMLLSLGVVYGLYLREIPDISWDGQAYHLPSILNLLAGINPATEKAELLWSEVYANGLWTLQAMIGIALGEPETGRALLPVVLITSYVYLFLCMRRDFQLSASISLLLSTALITNPVIAGEWLTFYLDSYVYLFSLVLLFATQAVFRKNSATHKTLSLWIAGALIVLLVTTKTTGVYFTPIIIIASFMLAIRTLSPRWHYDGLILIVVGIVSLLVVGFKPYITNFISYGFPLYPPPWEASDYLASQRPAEYQDLSRLQRFLASHVLDIFSIQNQSVGEFFAIKLLAPGDTRNGGFGPLYIIVLTGSIIAFFISTTLRPASIRTEAVWIGLAALVIFIGNLIFPESWWARLVPMLWAVPVIFCLTAFAPSKPNMVSLLATSGLAVLSLVAAISWGVATIWLHVSLQISAQKAIAYNLKNLPPETFIELIPLDPNWRVNNHSVYSWLARLERHGISTHISSTVGKTCKDTPFYEGANARLCQTSKHASNVRQ